MRGRWLILVLLPVLCKAQPGPWWAYGFGGPADDRITAITRGPGDTLYACGMFSGLMNHFNGQSISNGVTDIFLVKMDTTGTVYWTTTAGGPGPDRATDIAVDGNGDIIVVGQYSGTMTVGGEVLNSNGPSLDMFIAKWNAEGDPLWARSAGSPQNVDIAQHVDVDGSGNIFVGGEFSGVALFGVLALNSTFDPQLGAPGEDVFIAKYSPAGDPVWVKQGAAIHQDRALGLAVDANGNCWLAGQYSDAMTFDLTHPNTLNNAAFIAAFDAAGNEQWFRRIGGGGSVLVGDLVSAGGVVWLAGSQSGNNLIFGNTTVPIASAYPYSAFAVGFNAQGGVIAQRTLGSDHPIDAKGIDVQGGEILLGGTFVCQALELSEGAGGDGLMLSWGAANGWVGVLDQQAGLAVNYTQILCDHGSMDLRDVAFGPANAIFAVGEFEGELILPAIESALRVLPGDSLLIIGPNGASEACGDTTYYDAAVMRSRGVLDGFVSKGFIRQRRPLDIFSRDDCTFDLHPVFTAGPSDQPNCVVPGYDLSFCGQTILSAGFDYDFGPEPVYQWSDGSTGSGLTVITEGTYHVIGQVGQNCFSGADTLSIGLCPVPARPGITDDQGINMQDTVTLGLSTCLPELVTLTAGPITGVSFAWINPPDTLASDTVFTPDTDGIWLLQVVNEEGCSSSTTIQLNYTESDTLGSVVLAQQLAFPQDADGNDTITICSSDPVQLQLSLDLTLNGSGVNTPGSFNLSDTVIVGGVTIVDQGPFDMGAQPKQLSTLYTGDGWYVFTALMHINDLPCGDQFADAVIQDSIYVRVDQTSSFSQVDILGPIFLCSGQSVTLTAQASAPGSFDWSAENGGIIGPTDGNTLTIVQPGPITVNFTPADTGACALGDADDHSVTLVEPPTITMDPADGLVCPGGQVDLSVDGVSGTYVWYGPGGPLAGTGPTIQAADAGVYFCVANTVEGCAYGTALQTVSLYGTPYLSILPQPVLCAGGSVQVSVQPPQAGTYIWGPPLSGNTAYQTITAPGTYSISVERCGIITPLSFTISQSDPVVAIVDEGPFDICPQDSVLLQAVHGLVAYTWQPGNLVGEEVWATSEGEYAVIGFDAYGCTDTAYSAVVLVHDFAEPLTAYADTACAGGQNMAFADGSGTLEWYADPQAQGSIGSGPSVALGPFTGTTTVYVTQTDAQCTSLPVAVEAVVVGEVLPISILGDTIRCIGDPLHLIAEPAVDIAWTTPLGSFMGGQIDLPSVGVAADGLWSLLATVAGCPVGEASVQVVVSDPQVEVVDAGPFSICPGDSAWLQATAGMVSYAWYPGGTQGMAIFTQDTGQYYVVGMDGVGCRDTSGVVTVNGFFFTEPLSANAPVVCAGDTGVAQAWGSGVLEWFADGALSQPLGMGDTWSIPGIQATVILYVTQTEGVCASSPLAVPVPVTPLPPLPQIYGDNTLCTGDPLQLTVAPQFPSIWATPAGPVTGFLVAVDYATPGITGTYTVHYENDGCPGASSSVEVSVVPLPLVDLGPDRTLCIGQTVALDAGDALTWLWNTGSQEQVITVGVPGTYWVTILDPSGCTDADTLRITQDDCEVDIPNFFTPNGDGVNDVLTLSSPSGSPVTLEIYNRWGQVIHARTAPVVQWDGRNGFSGEEMPEGVYYYVLTGSLVDGTTLIRKGYIQLVR